MPRTKRALAEADGNSRSAPKPKRRLTASKENTVPAEKVRQDGQEPGISERSIGEYSCKDEVPRDTASADDTADKLAATIARLNEVPVGDEAKREEVEDAEDNTWICICRCRADKQRQHPELCLDQIEAHPGRIGKNCMCGRYADRNPEHNWIITWKSTDILMDAVLQVGCRDQNHWGIYIFNRWNSYAISEVLENMLAAFNKALKTPGNYMTIWSHTEALGRFLHCEIFEPYHGNYPEENAKRLMLIGTALLSAIDVLISHNLFHSNDNTVVRNIGLILCHYIHFGHLWTERCRNNEAGWMSVVIRKAQEHGVCIEGFYGIEEVIDKVLKASSPMNSTSAGKLNMIHAYEPAPSLCGIITMESLRAHEEGGTSRDWSRYDLKKEISAYRRHVMVKVGLFGPEEYRGTTIGGKFYDLTTPRNKAMVRQKTKEARELKKDLSDGESSESE